mmetsp:Transcript_42391/g.130877  ORF Transcript_42391/g.130877 Transcript_42391/m.130877 type:complete len:358 (-) Transcript_42391:282-1355(-)
MAISRSGTFFWCRKCSIGVSGGVSISRLTPRAPARAVRPARWMYVSTLSGQSYCTTQCTSGKSSPRAAMSVQKRTADLHRQKVRNTSSRRNCFILPVRHIVGTRYLRRIFDIARYMNRTWLHVEMKTMVLSFGWRLMKARSASSFRSSSMTMKFWFMFCGVGATVAACALACTGSTRHKRASAATSADCVAEKRSVCRSAVRGSWSRIPVTASWKPISSRRSASSSTSICTLSTDSDDASDRWCSTRPGVPTTMVMSANRFFSSSTLRPPVSSAAANGWRQPTTCRTLKICSASSRVGERMSAPRPLSPSQRSTCRRSITGSRKASVLPLPVLAAPSTSRPVRACGSAAAWMCVRCL